jgi:hypothetical protein
MFKRHLRGRVDMSKYVGGRGWLTCTGYDAGSWRSFGSFDICIDVGTIALSTSTPLVLIDSRNIASMAP